jgi:hypothetical protein
MNAGSAVAAASALRWRVVKLVVARGVAAALGAGAGGSAHARAGAAPSARPLAGPEVFSELSCHGGSFCLAVGSYARRGHRPLPLLEEWNGRRWRILPVPRWYYAITCGGPSFCLAATFLPRGPERTVVWNGRTWRTFRPQPSDVSDVTCESPTFCVTFDFHFLPSDILGWNGKGWHSMPGATDGCDEICNLDTLACATATNCWESGDTCSGGCSESDIVHFFETWEGNSWIQTAGPPPAGQACAGRGFCMTIALPATAKVTHDWWTSTQDASSNLAAVCNGIADCDHAAGLSCGSPWFCVAFPSAHPGMALAWNGATWRAVRVARVRGRIPDLTLLSCGAARNCAAFGSYRLAPGSQPRPVAEHWNGSTWQVTPMPNP